MTNDRIKAVLNRVSTWPKSMQQELAHVALEIEADMAGGAYHATADELDAIDEGLKCDPAADAEVEDAFAQFRRA
jgi:hypothetical protein